MLSKVNKHELYKESQIQKQSKKRLVDASGLVEFGLDAIVRREFQNTVLQILNYLSPGSITSSRGPVSPVNQGAWGARGDLPPPWCRCSLALEHGGDSPLTSYSSYEVRSTPQ